VKRGLLGWLSCALAFAVGLLTAALAAENRARGDELDRYERWCEAQSRKNELLRVENQRLEWQLLSGPCADRGARAHAGKEAAP
jgi:hypothetical protein